ncbi:two-component system, NarL family, sensor histidine kinase UhpB [Pseudoalteromonas citrea]|uniref:Two-component system, NarL family, sensor histidine kinase UhpB n=2 Tax=Pseudoalteromonas citrea TaxID=43655 RepID=A0AAD4ADX9_9GAMM|nr:histidine kinase [Pseudoalteromonas citrea]KAF7764180.1 two-component system, NarL family, sensor histidine kinase UhpB [Pseudoalteromonas citrea]
MLRIQKSSLATVLFTWLTVALPSTIGIQEPTLLFAIATIHGLFLITMLIIINDVPNKNHRLNYTLIAISIGLVICLMMMSNSYLYLIYSVMMTSIFAFHTPVIFCIGYIIVIHSIYLLIQFLIWQAGWDIVNTTTFIAFHCFALMLTQKMLSEKNAKEALTLSNTQLEAAHSLLANAAAHDERLKLARELHDNVGHTLTSLIINLDIARRTQSAQQITLCYEQAKAALDTTRNVVSQKRTEDHLDLPSTLIELAEKTPRIAVITKIPKQFTCTNLKVAHCVLRCCQEAITNTLKYAQATQFTIEITSQAEQLILHLYDNGAKNNQFTLGNGLTGMHERVQALGGKCSINNKETGFHIKIRVPHG